MLIDEDPVEHQDFLASRVLMATELRTRRITHDRGGAPAFRGKTLQRTPLDARQGRGLPVDSPGIEHHPLAQVSIDLHIASCQVRRCLINSRALSPPTSSTASQIGR
ncbi:hypothetical protein D3C86_1753480 [compost metagenome]